VGPAQVWLNGGPLPASINLAAMAPHRMEDPHVSLLKTFFALLRVLRRPAATSLLAATAEGNPARLGDLQSGLDGAQGAGLLEKEFAKDGIAIRWVQTLGSNKALEFLSAGSIDFGSTAGSAALVSKINGNPIKSIYVYSRPEWTALVTRKDSTIAKVSDLKGKRVAVTRGTDRTSSWCGRCSITA